MSKRSLFGVLAAMSLAASTWVVTAPAASSAPGVPKVTICHRTNSVTNPYVRITVDSDAVDGDTGNDNGLGDHTTHTGPIFDAENPPPPPHNEDQWGDIIPDIDENGDPRPPGSPTLNWTAEGQAIFANDCNAVDFGGVAVAKAVVDPDEVANPDELYSIHLVCTIDAGATTTLDENVSLKAGETSETFEVQSTSTCDASEETGALVNLVSATSDGPVVIETDSDSLVTITNTFAGTPEIQPEVVVEQPPVVAPAAVTATPRTTG